MIKDAVVPLIEGELITFVAVCCPIFGFPVLIVWFFNFLGQKRPKKPKTKHDFLCCIFKYGVACKLKENANRYDG